MKIFFTAFVLVVASLGRLAAAEAPEPPDADAKIIQTTKVPFPLALQMKGITRGEVRMMLEISAKGRPTDCLVVAFTHKEFVAEAVKAINDWRYVPARIDGKPVSAVVNFTLYFAFNGPLAVELHGPEPLTARETHYEYEPCPARDLDAEPKLVISVPPKYPEDLGKAGVKGTVFADFFVDEAGKVRFPIARPPADWRLGSLAVAALKLWEFEPPRRDGHPVLARVSTSFVFEPTPAH